METPKNKSKIDAMWREAFSLWPSLPKAQLMSGSVQESSPFMGTKTHVGFSTQHPMEHSIGADAPDMADRGMSHE